MTRFIGLAVAILLLAAPVRADEPAYRCDTDEGNHASAMLEVLDAASAPRISLAVHPSVETGWNLRLRVENFRFAPENPVGAHRDGEGHALLCIDGTQTARLYGPWHHIAALGPGLHEIVVVLRTNDGRRYGYDARSVSAVVWIEGRPVRTRWSDQWPGIGK